MMVMVMVMVTVMFVRQRHRGMISKTVLFVTQTLLRSAINFIMTA